MDKKMNRNDVLMNAVSFEYLLLDCYARLGLSEDELAVCLMIRHLLEQGNSFLTADMLSLKMSLKTKQIDETIASLLKKKFVSYVPSKDGGLSVSLDSLEMAVKKEFASNLTREQNNSLNREREKDMQKLVSLFEDKFVRTLSPLEISTLSDWLNNGYSLDEIKNALLDALRQNKKTIKAVNKILINRRKQDDIEKEGASGVSERWDKNIEETIAATKALWGDPNNDK